MTPQVVETPKRTRAEVLRSSVVIRLALDTAAPEIQRILSANGIELPGADWSRVFPSWLIATVNDEVVGCLMVMPAKPVSFMEFLAVDPVVNFKLRAIAIRKLIMAALATAMQNGSSYAACPVDEANEKFAGVLEKIGSISIRRVRVWTKRLKE